MWGLRSDVETRMSLRSAVRSQQGVILPLVLVFLGLGILLMTPTLGLATTALTTGSLYEEKTMEAHAADAGMERGMQFIKVGGWDKVAYPTLELDEFEINGCIVNVTLSTTGKFTDDEVPAPIYHINSVASVKEGSQTTINAYISGISFGVVDAGDIHGQFTFDEDSIVVDDVGNLTGKVSINSVVVFEVDSDVDKNAGTVEIDGTAIFHCYVPVYQGNAASAGTVVFCGGLGEIQGSASSSGTLVVIGDLNLHSDMPPLEGTTIVTGNISGAGVTHNSIVGDLCCPGTITGVDISGATLTTECGDVYADYCSIDFADFKVISYLIG